jgi:essential recombination function protein|nr:MAG TPA: ERF superfamily protein [Caudoviricetes sp.]
MNIYEKINKIQVELKAPKSQRNNFGNYNFRNCEDILEALKPLLLREKIIIQLSDELVQTGDRFYIKATATLIDVESGEKHSATAFAREELSKKGMDGSQITGASSSYARKYALNGLLAIDDTKDSDTTNTHNNNDSKNQKKQASTEEKRKNGENYIAKNTQKYQEMIDGFFETHNAKNITELSNDNVSELARKIYELEKLEKGA